MHSNKDAYAADYPVEPTAEARSTVIDGQCMPMTMQAVSADGTLFATGVVELPADDPVWRQRTVEALHNGLFANLKGHMTKRGTVVQTTAQPPLSLPALELTALGVGGDDPAPRRLITRVVATGKHVYQAVVLESGDAARDARQQEQVDQFLANFHPYWARTDLGELVAAGAQLSFYALP